MATDRHAEGSYAEHSEIGEEGSDLNHKKDTGKDNIPTDVSHPVNLCAESRRRRLVRVL